MSRLGTDDCVVGIGESFQAQAICGGAIEDKENLDVIPEDAFEVAYSGLGVGVVTVPDDVALINSGDCLQNLGMDAGIVVAGEAASGLQR